MSAVRLIIFAVFVSILPYSVFGYAVQKGATRDEVIATYGYPASQAKAEGKELLNYKEGIIVLENDRVVEFRFKKGEPAMIKPRVEPSLPAPLPKPQPVPQPQPQPRIVYVPVPAPATGITVWKMFIPLFVIAGAGIVLRAMFGNGKRKTVRRDEFLDNKRKQPVPSVQGQARAPIVRLTREALDLLEWRRFEELIHGYYETQGWRAQRSRVGADGGIDIFLYRPGEHRPGACVQCKAWHTYSVGVKPVRELLGVMAAEQIPQGYFVTTGTYTAEATAFASQCKLELLTGDDIIGRFAGLSAEDHAKIVKYAFREDFETPTCPSCDKKMVRREAETPFWGCSNYPRCRQTFKMRES